MISFLAQFIQNVVENILKCKDAVKRDVKIAKDLTNGYFNQENCLTKIEDYLMELASYKVCDGMILRI